MKEMLICFDVKKSENKFYEIELIGDMVYAWSGRVGVTRIAQKPKSGGEVEFKKRKAAKIKKGYTVSDVDLSITESTIVTGGVGNIMTIAMDQIKTDDVSKLLIKKLVDQNIHNITSSTKIKYDINTGYFKTDLGVITQKGVDKAINALNAMDKFQDKMGKLTDKQWDKFVSLNETYFRIIPTDIGTLRDHKNLLINRQKVSNQLDICNSLIDTLRIIEAAKKDIKDKSSAKVFDTSVYELTDKKEFARLVKYFNDSKNSRHGHNNYNVEKIYKISLGKEESEYRKDLDNQMELFHGTKIANLLSILKSGLLMPKQSPGQTTGYMFGQGLYFASQSTKSLNYCDGMYWNSSAKQDKIYMFIADIAMGNYQIPSRSISRNPDSIYDSYWAKSGQSGIQNDEMIIFKNNQIRLKYILEITK